MSRLPVLLMSLPLIGCSSEPSAPTGSVPSTPQFTVGSGVTRNDLAQSTFAIDQVSRITDKWHFQLKAKDGFELAVRRFDYAASTETVVTNTGWHRHPGPVFIQVVTGTVTFYEADDPNCTPIVVPAGGAYLDLGEHGHIGRNETTQPAQDVTVLFGPPGTAPNDFRKDLSPAPGNCPF
jgi:quercetin dioxygenase-like cupin family protein